MLKYKFKIKYSTSNFYRITELHKDTTFLKDCWCYTTNALLRNEQVTFSKYNNKLPLFWKQHSRGRTYIVRMLEKLHTPRGLVENNIAWWFSGTVISVDQDWLLETTISLVFDRNNTEALSFKVASAGPITFQLWIISWQPLNYRLVRSQYQ